MADIPISALTEGSNSTSGTGVFDELMKAANAHIKAEYKAGRIKGTDYATVYLGGMQAVLQQSTQFLLSKQKADKEAELLAEQVESENLRQENLQAENAVLVAQECKLRGEYDLLMEQKLKTVAETALLNQKKVTEQAQTSGVGVGPDSVIGKQIALYEAQAKGYVRDAEQKVAKLMVDTWNVRKTMDESGAAADDRNKLGDDYIGAVIQKLLDGVNASTV